MFRSTGDSLQRLLLKLPKILPEFFDSPIIPIDMLCLFLYPTKNIRKLFFKEKFMKLLKLLFPVPLLVALFGCASGGTARIADPETLKNRIYIANMTPPGITVVDLNALGTSDEIFTVYFRNIAKKDQSHLISVSADGRYIWTSEVISPTGGYVQVIDAATMKIRKKWNVGAGVGNHISHDGRWFFSSSEKTNNQNINVFDVEKQICLGYIELGGFPHNYDTTADGKTLYTTKYPSGILVEFDLSPLTGIAEGLTKDQTGVRLPIEPKRTFDTGGLSAHAVLVHPNGRYVVVGAYKPNEKNPARAGGIAYHTAWSPQQRGTTGTGRKNL
jgi:hypothetical protein